MIAAGNPSSFAYAAALAVALLIPASRAAAQPATTTAPSSTPAQRAAAQPRLAVIGFEANPDGDPRDAWLAVAFEETLTRRLRRAPGVTAVPAIRLHQARRELQEQDKPLPPWPRVARGLGASHLISGQCDGPADAVRLELKLSPLNAGSNATESVSIPAGRLVHVLDEATRWVLERFDAANLDESVAGRVFTPPSASVSAIEYHARAAAAVYHDKVRDALRYANQSLNSDRRFRPAIGLLAQLEMRLGADGRKSAGLRLRILSDLARQEGDEIDRASAELAMSMLAQADGASEAALTRAQHALELASGQRDLYGRIAALSWITDLYLSWQPPDGTKLSAEQRRQSEQKNLQHAATNQRKLLDVLTAIGDVIASLPASNKLAVIYERLGDSEAACRMHKRTLELANAVDSRSHQATAWLFLGQWYRQQQRWQEALDAMNHCLELADPAARPAVQIALGSVYQGMEAFEQALAQFESAFKELQKTDDLVSQFNCLRDIAQTRMQLGRRQEAIAALRDALDLAHVLELREEEALRAELQSWEDSPP